jgi:hypothetical protein
MKSAPPADLVRAFRRQAADLRRALRQSAAAGGPLRMVDGYLESKGWLAQMRRLAIPIRRTWLVTDKASFIRSAQALQEDEDADVRRRAAATGGKYDAILAELATQATLGGRKLARADLLRTWIDAVVFYDSLEKQKPYEAMLEEYGRAIEGLALQFVQQMADCILELDEIAAAALGEPVEMPEPPPLPPPPKPTIWEKLMRKITGRPPDPRFRRT